MVGVVEGDDEFVGGGVKGFYIWFLLYVFECFCFVFLFEELGDFLEECFAGLVVEVDGVCFYFFLFDVFFVLLECLYLFGEFSLKLVGFLLEFLCGVCLWCGLGDECFESSDKTWYGFGCVGLVGVEGDGEDVDGCVVL